MNTLYENDPMQSINNAIDTDNTIRIMQECRNAIDSRKVFNVSRRKLQEYIPN